MLQFSHGMGAKYQYPFSNDYFVKYESKRTKLLYLNVWKAPMKETLGNIGPIELSYLYLRKLNGNNITELYQ